MSPARRFCWIVAGAVAVAGCGTQRGKAPKPEEETLPRVETVSPEWGLMPIHIELSAVVEPMEKADLCARVPGVIESLQLDSSMPEVDIGRLVTAGEPLVKLAIPDLEAEKAYKEALLEQAKRQKDQTVEAEKVAEKELQEAREQERRYQAEFKRSQEKHDRTVRLTRSGSLSQELVEETTNQLEAAGAAWQVSRAQIETKQAKLNAMAADLRLAEVRITVAQREVNRLAVLVDYATVRAPFDGIVTKRWVDRGATVKDPTTPLVTVMRTDKVRVLLDIPQNDVPLVNATDQNPNPDGKGDQVVVHFPGLRAGPTVGKFKGNITRVASALDPTTRTMRVEVHLENRAGSVPLPLRPGMYGTASVLLDEGKEVMSIPSSALVRRGSQAMVFHVADVSGNPLRGVVHRVDVEVGLDDGRRVEIRTGLTGKELIISKGNGVLRDGDKVIAVPAKKP
jgi:RND family efflux transporter MFP subunit